MQFNNSFFTNQSIWNEGIKAFSNVIIDAPPEKDISEIVDQFLVTIHSCDEPVTASSSQKLQVHHTHSPSLIDLGEKWAEYFGSLPTNSEPPMLIKKGIAGKNIISYVQKLSEVGCQGKNLCKNLSAINRINQATELLFNRLGSENNVERVQFITKAIDELERKKGDLTNKNKATALEMVNTTTYIISEGNDLLDDLAKLDLLNETAKTVQIAHNFFTGFSFVCSTGALILNIKKSIESNEELNQLNNEINKIENELKNTKLDPYLAHMIQIKKDYLLHKVGQLQYSLASQILATAANGLSVVGGVKAVLIAAGVAVGATATTALTATGFGALGVGGLLLLSATGKAVYDNRHTIAYQAQKAPISFTHFQEKRSLFNNLDKWKQAIIRKQALEIRVLTLNEKISKLVNELEANSHLPDSEKKREIESNVKADLERNKQKIEKMNRNITHLEQNIIFYQSQVKSIDDHLVVAEKQLKDKKETYHWKKLESVFKHYDTKTLQVIEKIMLEGITNKKGRTAIINHLKKTGLDGVDEKSLSFEKILAYVTE
jgi:hypothetical protein